MRHQLESYFEDYDLCKFFAHWKHTWEGDGSFRDIGMYLFSLERNFGEIAP
jgi:hypothetical protein